MKPAMAEEHVSPVLMPCSAHSCFQNSMPTTTQRTKKPNVYWALAAFNKG